MARILVVGAGRMGAQIGVEYALGGHHVVLLSRSRERADANIRAALEVCRKHELASTARIEAGGENLNWRGDVSAEDPFDVIVESLPEDFDLKVAVLAPLLVHSPAATMATNTSSLSVTELGKALGRDADIVGTHYWNPPLLMPLVELVAGDGTSDEMLEQTAARLRDIGKIPVTCSDVPGFVWNRLQFAILREALALVDAGVVSVEAIDLVFRKGLGRRWSNIGLFESIALGGVATFEAVARNLFPELHTDVDPAALHHHVGLDDTDAERIARERDHALAAALRAERTLS